MQTGLRALRLLALIAWLGGLLFFGAVLAPVAFNYLPSAHEAGIVVGGSLLMLHIIGFVCGITLILTTLVLARTQRNAIFCGITALMLVLTAFSQYSILPRMETDRASAGGDITTAPTDDPGRIAFERLHHLSEYVEEAVMLGGLALTVMLAQRPD